MNETQDTFVGQTKSAASSATFFEGIPFIKYLLNNKRVEDTFKSSKMIELDKITKQSLKNVFKGEGSLISRIGNFISTANTNKNIYRDLKDETKYASKALKLNKKAAKTTAKLSKYNSKLDMAAQKVLDGEMQKKSFQKLNNKVAKVTKKLTKKSGKINEAIVKNASKVTKSTENTSKLMNEVLNKAGKTAAESTGVLSKLGKFGKFIKSSGAGMMLVFSGISEFLTEVKPTFNELGKEKGMKQLGKSAIKVAGDTFGFIAGEQIGTAVGSAIGTAIFPGVGTAVGAVVGFIGGLLGSFAAGKLTGAITGKSERELAKEEQENSDVLNALNNNDELQKLRDEVFNKIKSDFNSNNGQLSNEALEISNIIYQT